MTAQKSKNSKNGLSKKVSGSSVLLIGAGRMGTALLNGWVANKVRNITVVEPNQTTSLKKFAKKYHFNLATNISDLSKNIKFETVVVAIKPQVLKAEAAELKDVAHNATVISIAAGTSIKSLKGAWGKGARIVRAMPNTPGSIGRGITGLYAAKGVRPVDINRADKLLSALGETVWVKNEDLIDSVTAISGSGPAYIFHMVEALTTSGMSQGLPRLKAEQLARATVMGAGRLLESNRKSAKSLREEVTSPGGTTEAALKKLTRGMTPLMERTVTAAKKRAKQLS